MNNKEIGIIRIGEIGDIITAVEFCKNYNYDLIVSETKKKLISNKKLSSRYFQNISAISKNMSFPIKINKKLNDLKKYKKIFFLVQKNNLISKIYTKILGLIIRRNIKIIYEGSNYFHIAHLKQNENVKKKIKNLLKKRENKIKLAICWKGKEKEKNIPIKNLKKLLYFTSKNGFQTTLLGDKKVDITINGIHNLSGFTTLDEAMQIINKTDILISVDTGLLHYSVSKNKLNIALVAHRYELAIWYPFNSYTYLIYDFCSKISPKSTLNKNIINYEIESIFN